MTTDNKVTSENIYGDPSLAHRRWYVRHDDEVWTEDDHHVCACSNAPDAHHIVALHNTDFDQKEPSDG